MHDLRYVSESLDTVRSQLSRRGFDDPVLFRRLEELAAKRKNAIAAVEGLRQERNEASQAMAQIADKKSEAFAKRRDELRVLGDKVKEQEVVQTEVQSELEAILLSLPNLPAESTPDGKGENDNVEVRVWGTRPNIEGDVRDHVDIGVSLGIMDFERASKISGARFVVLKGAGARMERALMQFMLDLHTETHGYTEVWPPVLVKDSAMRGTGQLPKFAADAFRIAKDHDWAEKSDAQGHDLYLIPTAEVPITNMHADEILEADTLPIAYTAYTACFRSEAGSYGKDTRGMIRQHQFDKVELVRFCNDTNGEAQLETLTAHAEAVLQRLDLHYRVVQLCAGDLGFSSKKTYDLEVWLPAQNAFREISSCSWFGDFQARRMNARYRPEKKGKPRLLHTLNGSGLAIGRTLVAILEQNQQKDGSVTIPKALRTYMGGIESIRPV
ncbi:MAG: serine--tRNA ligase [Polyangiales bacterium]